MKRVALSNGESVVQCSDGTKSSVECADGCYRWDMPSTHRSGPSTHQKVLIQGVPVVVDGDAMEPHPSGSPCTDSPVLHAPHAESTTQKIFVNGKAVVAVGDKYTDDGFSHIITTGSEKVFIQ